VVGIADSSIQTRMGTGKGSMDYWAARVPVSRVIFELKGEIHEQIVKDAFRIASAKLPGIYSQYCYHQSQS
jgi:ribosomal protein L16